MRSRTWRVLGATALAGGIATLHVLAEPVVTTAVLAGALFVVLSRLINVSARLRRPSRRRRSASAPALEESEGDGDAGHGAVGARLGRSLQLRDDESRILELIAGDAERSVVLEAITQLLANHFTGEHFRIASSEPGMNETIDRVWPILDATDVEPAWSLEAVLRDPNAVLEPDVIVLAVDLARLGLDKARTTSKLRYQADHDSLTGLLSRRAVLGKLDSHIKAADAVGLVYGDVDHFKKTNDRMGHLVGDQLLCGIADRLREAAERENFPIEIGRLGGDEYLCVLSDCAAADVTRFATELSFSMKAPLRVGQATVSTTMSFGIAHISDDDGPRAAVTSGELLREADVALYQVKRGGRNAFRMFDAELRAWSVDRQELERDLQISISKRSGIHAQFQPLFDVDRRLVGFEALGRWYRQGVGLVPPDQFIPVAIERGLMAEFDHEIFQHVSSTLGGLRRDGRRMGYVTANVSAERLERPDFVDSTLDALRAASIDPRTLVLEITESSLLRDLNERGRRLEELRRWGIRIAIDDFGTGYSSLSYLRTLPVDIVKLDREFVSDIDSSAESQAIVRAILTLAQAMRLRVVAEGVERESQFELLAGFGCDVFQGFLLGRPLDIEVAKTLAAERWPHDPALAESDVWANPARVAAKPSIAEAMFQPVSARTA
ncbi:MAG: putative bifunctional diguanylate cyclase/phosphodiesterase [Acidimicrobiales bacterium]